MSRIYKFLIAGVFVAMGSARSADGPAVLRLDPALDAVVSQDAKVELVKGGFGFTEGPVWVRQGKSGFLLFTDIPGNVVWKLTPAGKASVHLKHAVYPGPDQWRWGPISDNGKEKSDPGFEQFVMNGADGLGVDPQGRLILAGFAARTLERVEKNGVRTILADGFQGKRFGGPNDIAVKRDGAIYFTDTFGALQLREKDKRGELEYTAVFRWKNGTVTLMAKDMPKVNGLAFSPDEKYLYVNGSSNNYVNRYDVLSDGSLSNGTKFFDLTTSKERGITDGLRVDTKGNLYETGPGGIWIISPEGKHLGTIRAPEEATNVGFGSTDMKTLYIAARSSIYKVRVNTPGR